MTGLFTHKKHWAHKFLPAPILPMTMAEMHELGWDSCDVIIVTGDAFVDHPSFGAAVIARVLEAHGFRTGIIAQPDWQSADAFRILGRPNLFFGVTSGNMDSMVNRYTADNKPRSDDAYSPDGRGGLRPDRSVLVYTQRCHEAWPDVPVVIGGIEASLRRTTHYDYWSNKLRRSVLLDSKADILVFGNGERQIVDIAFRTAAGELPRDIHNIPGTAVVMPPDADHLPATDRRLVELPSHEAIVSSSEKLLEADRRVRMETHPESAPVLIQRTGNRMVRINPPALPLTTAELDAVHELPYTRLPHPAYGDSRIPAWEMIRHSVIILRGCFGGCAFCSITLHEGRLIQSRSEASILREIADIRDRAPGFTGIISDLGGPTANMYRMGCSDPSLERVCRRLSCLYPSICRNLNTGHESLLSLYRRARGVEGVKKVLVASGVRHDLALKSKQYIRELTQHHVGGYLKLAPEHTQPEPLAAMLKPGVELFDRFRDLFKEFSKDAGKEQYIIPYFIAAHPGTTSDDMLELALYLKKNGFRPDQVQTFLPLPMTLSAAMFATGKNPLQQGKNGYSRIEVPSGLNLRRVHKAFLRWHDPENWPLLRRILTEMGRADLIGNGKKHLVPTFQPVSRKKAPR
ncbi:YgiQ family radical SAM protein [bacterium]|nr:YgiQ family radical SAM protein [candidate division CSSED10-310 bacterium]